MSGAPEHGQPYDLNSPVTHPASAARGQQAESRKPGRIFAEQTEQATSISSEERSGSDRWTELIGVLLLIALADVTIYRGKGFAGYAVLFVAAPLLLWLASVRQSRDRALWTMGTMLVLLAAKLCWCGSWELVAIGFSLLTAFAAALAGFCPYVLRVLIYASQTIQAGYLGLAYYNRSVRFKSGRLPRGAWMTVGLPAFVGLLFGGIFVLANPDVVHWVGERVANMLTSLREFLGHAAPDALEVLFWIATLWIVVGLLRPVEFGPPVEGHSANGNGHQLEPQPDSHAYAAYRNTLVTVIVLFAIYLAFEFATLWFREFPKGFYYSGYAHEGAAWLTAALALATGTLSLVFRGGVLRDPRVGKLRRLAWIWSIQNLILAVAVYHRMLIYIGFNGMTAMRIVGFYGISAVVVGFALVLWKIARSKSFGWLVQRHLWTLAVAIYLLYLTPSDAIWVKYNVDRILGGDPAPSVQIAVHPISAEGVLLLKPLLECENAVIRDGVAAMLVDRQLNLDRTIQRQRANGWTAFQFADRLVRERLASDQALAPEFSNPTKRSTAFNQFYDYAWQWY